MCRSIWIDGREATNQGELASLIGRDNVVYHYGDRYRANGCLCAVKSERIAQKIGCQIVNDGVQEFFIRPGQEYLWRCDECGAEFSVADKDHVCIERTRGLSYSGPRFVADSPKIGD